MPFAVFRPGAAHVVPLGPIRNRCRHQFFKQPPEEAWELRFSVEQCHGFTLAVYDPQPRFLLNRGTGGLGLEPDERLHENDGRRRHDDVRQRFQDESRRSLQHGRTP